MLEHTLVHLSPELPAAELCRVSGSQGLVVFIRPDGGPATVPRSQAVLLRLQARGFSTLDLDLLNSADGEGGERASDVELLTRRLDQALGAVPASVKHEPLGLFASDSGAAAMLRAAASHPRSIRALVSRSGRVDQASDVLGDLRIPTLLVVAAGDPELVEANRQAFGRLRCEKRIDVVPRATHHFLEAGTLDVVAQLASDWLTQHLATGT
ncbi:alpha/beta hydrolase [Piscinibacter sp. HJYY11]|uniref:alpha/beta hydrolase n=1 Tax=Piscinibacter sp. HJYY11 TaxID=2801333 RepID=UPI00191F8049|nr:alpha/beta hydrolase [Piscinibacter sp. HJYY11]MBL0726506.1 alpha/beta hydrolase [Piscinibacter sp. HJYY11]